MEEDSSKFFFTYEVLFPFLKQENKDREIQEIQQMQRLKDMEERRRSWAVGELGAFGRSSSENDVGVLTKRGLEEFLPFLQQRPHSPSYRNAGIRRSRHSLGVTADRELLTFLENSKDEDANKSNSLPNAHASEERPSIAWIASKEPGDSSLTKSRIHRASDGGMDCSYFQLPTSQSDHINDLVELDTVSSDLYNEQESADSDKYRFNVPCTEATGTALWDLSLEEHELVSGLLKFDLHGTNAMEDHFEAAACDFETLGDSNLHSSGKAGVPVPACRTSKETVNKPERSAKVASHAYDDSESNNDSPTSSDGSFSGIKGHVPKFYVSDISDCSLVFDASEGNYPNLGGNKLNREGDSLASFMNDLQTCNNAILDASSSFPNDTEDLGSKPEFLKEKPVKNKDASGPKRNSLKEKSSSSVKSSTSPPNHPRPVRTLNSSENANMRKVVPISRSTKAAPPSSTKKPEAKPASRDTGMAETRLMRRNSIRGIADPASKPPYRQSISVEEPKLQRGTAASSSGSFEREPLQHKGSFKKPSSKPVRYIPKSKNDETKMCRSSAKTQPPADPSKNTPVATPKTPAPVPSFARNTVASSSRFAKVDLPATSKPPTLTRSLSQRLPRMRMTAASDDSTPKENSVGTLKRANSARMIKRNTDSSDLSVKVEPVLKEQTITEKSASLQSNDGNQTTVGKILNHF